MALVQTRICSSADKRFCVPFLLFVCLQIEDISGRKNVRMLYVDDEGDHVYLDNSGEANASFALRALVASMKQFVFCLRERLWNITQRGLE